MLHAHIKALVVALFLGAAFHAAADIRGVIGYGAFPVSPNTLAVWLNGEDGKPLIMVYYHGPAQWHDTHWTFDSQFTQERVGWQEFKSDKTTLRFLVDLGAGRAEVQHKSFSLEQNNTFLVVHTTDAHQKVIPLGRHKLLKTGQNPAAVMLLDADKALKTRIEKEAGGI
jgi:hypothetical protein